MWYDCQRDNCPQETKITQTLTALGHRTAFNNEESQKYVYTCLLSPDRKIRLLVDYAVWALLVVEGRTVT